MSEEQTAQPTARTVDVVVIGAGPAGENAADYAHRGGLSAVLVESELVGGECSYWACMPSKALLRPIELLAEARAVEGVRQAVTGALDVSAVLERRDGFTSDYDDVHQVAWAEGAGIEVVRGSGRLSGEREVTVERRDGTSEVLTARHAVVLATGTGAALPPIPGLALADPWTSRELTAITEVPRRVVVLGGGVVACEGAQILTGRGAEVTLLEGSPSLLGKVEPWAAERVAIALRGQGVVVHTGTKVRQVARPDAGGPVTVTADGPEGQVTVEADEVLAALGRHVHTDHLGLEVVGLDPGAPVPVDDHLTVTSVPGSWLYAVGDCNGRVLLTHMGKYQARVAGDVIVTRAQERSLDGPRFAATSDAAAVPQVIFTDPQVAAVGLTEAQARDTGVRVGVVSAGAVAGSALLREDWAGEARWVIDLDREVLLGMTFVGPDVAELLHAATVAIVGAVPMERLWHAVPSYPTVSEIYLRLLEAWRSGTFVAQR